MIWRSALTTRTSNRALEASSRPEVPDTSAGQIPETRYARSGDVSIAYQVVGDGPFDVVFVPSLSHIELMWSMPNHQGEIPRRLASFARLISRTPRAR